MKSEWKLEWNTPDSEEYIHFKQINENGEVIREFNLQPPDHAKLYYALKDWFQDD